MAVEPFLHFWANFPFQAVLKSGRGAGDGG